MPIPIILGVAAAAAAAVAIGAALSDDDSSSSSSSSNADREKELQKEKERIERQARAELIQREAKEKAKNINDQVVRQINKSKATLQNLINPYVDINSNNSIDSNLVRIALRSNSLITNNLFDDKQDLKDLKAAKASISNIPQKHKEIRDLFSIWDIKKAGFATAVLRFQSLYGVEIKPKQAFLDKQKQIKQAEKELQRLEASIEQLGKKLAYTWLEG